MNNVAPSARLSFFNADDSGLGNSPVISAPR